MWGLGCFWALEVQCGLKPVSYGQGDLGLGVGFRVQGLGFSGLVVGVQPSGIVQGNQAKS